MSRDLRRRESGFTLIEVLTVVIIVGVLAAVAIPTFLNQRRRAVDAALRTDMHNIAAAYEDWAIDHPGQPYPDAYVNWGLVTNRTDTVLADMGVRLSPTIRVHAFDVSAYPPPGGYPPGLAFCIEMFSTEGSKSGRSFYHSGKGGQITVTCQDP